MVSAARALPPVRGEGGRREQDAAGWWDATCEALREALSPTDAGAVSAVCVDATSGTIVPVDRDGEALGPGIMYNDGRAVGYAERLNAVAGSYIEAHGHGFKDNFALSKLLWLAEHDPGFERTWKVLHQSDYVNARLAGGPTATDWSNALKTGCDLHAGGWAPFIAHEFPHLHEKLPDAVVAPGMRLGEVCSAAADRTGLRAGTVVVAGASDGTASLLAIGAAAPGEFNTALGSTLTIKGVTREIVHDPDGVVYCHRHPEGYWLPGGAGNVGCAALNAEFAPGADRPGDTLRVLDATIEAHLPCDVMCYPLGELVEERFPFRKNGIRGFFEPEPSDRDTRYAAMLQGVAFVERWCYEKIGALGGRVTTVHSTGGGSRSLPWCRLRADVLGRPLYLPEQAETAFGSAVLAAAHVQGSFEAASRAMVRSREQVDPTGRDYEALYARFREAVARRFGL